MKTVVAEVMTPLPVCVGPETTLRDLVELLSEHCISGVPVVAAGNGLVGVVSVSDLVDFMASSPGPPTGRRDVPEWGELEAVEHAGEDAREDPAASGYFVDMWEDAGADVVTRFTDVQGPEWDILDEHTVEELMSRALITVSSDAPISDAAQLLLGSAVHRLLVVDDGALRGVVTGNDLLGAWAAPQEES
jgi:CBS domain-containing protein